MVIDSMPTVKLTKSYVDNLAFSEAGKVVFYRDSDLVGFAVKVTSQSKSYIAEKKLFGTPCRVKICDYKAVPFQQAKEMAREVIYQISQGINPNENKKIKKQLQVEKSVIYKAMPTLIQAYEQYKIVNTLKEKTIKTYDICINDYFADWKNHKLADITPKMVVDKFTRITQRSPAQANIAIKLLHAIYNYAQRSYIDESGVSYIETNPAKIIKQQKSMNRIKRRRTYIRHEQLYDWAVAVATTEWAGQQNDDVWAYTNQDFLLVMALTGFRRSETEQLEWSNIDLKFGTIIVPNPKNSEPLILPMGDMLWHIIKERHSRSNGCKYVFMNKELNNHVSDRRDARQKVIKNSGINFTFHDLRRTFSTVANRLAIGSYTIKRLINHTVEDDPYDVTDGYIQVDFDELRRAMNMIESVILPAEMRHLILEQRKTPK